MYISHRERHRTDRIGWLRAAVLGANDGIISTASLIVGVAASSADRSEVLVAGVAALFAGAMSMAAGEYVSVSSQSDTEKADLERERRELETDNEHEVDELAHIYENRGLQPDLAREVALQLMIHDALGAHARDELGIFQATTARPVQAALTSAATFSAGAVLPLLAVLLLPENIMAVGVTLGSVVLLTLLGAAAAKAGGASMVTASVRVAGWGALAMAVTAAIGYMFGTVA